uniref:Uncharacterized protein LOC100179023 n=1 Tax=Phallusia mammillata TaxID=59560 RepID=A0A6F9DHP7_9ASCI|nr:uncharacterized protein LOC100179023 [Phallusia mammillata]
MTTSIFVAVLFGLCVTVNATAAFHRTRSTLDDLYSYPKNQNSLSGIPPKSNGFTPGSAAQPFSLWTLRNGMVTYPSKDFPKGVPIGFHAFSNKSAFLECMWTNSNSLTDFVETAPLNARYVFMTFEDNAYTVIAWMESVFKSALMKSKLSKEQQDTFRKQCYFVVSSVDDLGNWIPSLLSSWACDGHGCGYDQVQFYYAGWSPQIVTSKRLDARYDWAFNHQWKPTSAILSAVTDSCSTESLKSFKNGTVAVLSNESQGCSIATKVANLQTVGAAGIIVYSKAGSPVQEFNCNGDECNIMINIPVISIPYSHQLVVALSMGSPDVTATLQTTSSPNFYFTIDCNGNLAEAGWFLYPSLEFLAWQMQWLEYKSNLQSNISELTDYVVPVFNGTTMQGKSGTGYATVTLNNLHTYQSLYLDMQLGCPGTMDEDCPPWDHTPTLYVSCDKSSTSWTEIGRWITSFRRKVGHWLTDISPLLPVLSVSQGETQECTFQLKMTAWWAKAWVATLNLRFVQKPHSFAVLEKWSNNMVGPYAYSVVPLFQGGTFDKTYNQNYKPYQFEIPSGVKAVQIYAVITGHGSDNNNCAEFCVTSHHFSINNKTYIRTFTNAGTPLGCAHRVPQGVVPNEHGTWLYGRDGWCDGQQVDPWVIDITMDVKSSSSNTVTYKGLFNGKDPNPTQNPGVIKMVSYLVYYK